MEREFVKVEMTVEKIFDGSEMRFEVLESSEKLSEKFKNVLREDYDIDVDEYSEFVRTVVGEEDIIPVEEWTDGCGWLIHNYKTKYIYKYSI